MEEQIICEKLAPNDCLILTKDETGITYVGNKNGKVFVTKVFFSEVK